MSDTTSLGDRMKRYEAVTRAVLVPRSYTVLRVDVRAAHSYLRGAERPFDEQFMRDMDGVAEALCAEIDGAVLAYTQSDEVSVLYADFGSEHTQPWFGGVLAKQVSIGAAIATAALNEARPGKRALFDARVFTLPDAVEVANYLIWRQRDAVRNSISMAAQARFSHKQLHGVNAKQMQELLRSQYGINWNDYPTGTKRGRLTRRRIGLRKVTWTDRRDGTPRTDVALRSWWETDGAPHFTAEPDGFLAATIPAAPRLIVDEAAQPEEPIEEQP